MTQEPQPPAPGNRGPSDQELDRATPPATGGREVRIGIFVLLGVLSTLMVLFLLTDPATFRGRYMVLTEVDDAGGVRRGDPVQMRGVNIGRVHRFDMVGERVGITLEIEGHWEIPEDSRTRVAGVGLLGGRTIEVLPGDSDVMLREGEAMPGESTEDFLELAEVLGSDARNVMNQIQALLADTTVASIRASAADLERLLETTTQIAEEQRSELLALSRSLSRSAARVEDLTASEELDRSLARADSTLADLRVAGANLTRATSSLEEVLDRMERGEGTLGRLSADDELYRNLNEAAAAILFLAQDIQENPGRYVRLRIF